MKSVKYPKWDEVQVDEKQLLLSPGTSREKVSLNHLEVGMMAKASVMGAAIEMRLSKITSPGSVEAEILKIFNKDDTIEGLNIGDAVFVELRDMEYRKENRVTLFSSVFSSAIYVTSPLFELFDFNCIFNYHNLLTF